MVGQKCKNKRKKQAKSVCVDISSRTDVPDQRFHKMGNANPHQVLFISIAKRENKRDTKMSPKPAVIWGSINAMDSFPTDLPLVIDDYRTPLTLFI
jgi:hypothetical protein